MFSIDNAYLSEFLPPRGKSLAWMTNTVPLGGMVPPVLFLLVPHAPAWLGWRLIPAVIVIPAFLVFLVRRVLPESVRFLISRNKVEEADAIARKLEAGAGPAHKYDGPAIMPHIEHRARARPQTPVEEVSRAAPALLHIDGRGSWNISRFLPTVLNQGLGGVSLGALSTVIVAEALMVFTMFGRNSETVLMGRPGRRFNMIVGNIIPAVSALIWSYPFVNRGSVPPWEVIRPALGGDPSRPGR